MSDIERISFFLFLFSFLKTKVYDLLILTRTYSHLAHQAPPFKLKIDQVGVCSNVLIAKSLSITGIDL